MKDNRFLDIAEEHVTLEEREYTANKKQYYKDDEERTFHVNFKIDIGELIIYHNNRCRGSSSYFMVFVRDSEK